MSGSSNSIVTKLVDRVFPRMPDFYTLINEQCDLAVEAMTVFVEFMETGDVEKANKVREFEHLGDELKERNTDILNKAFATPMDREDIYRAITSVDHVVNYAKTTVREIEILGLKPDQHMLLIATHLLQGTEALKRGFGKLATAPSLAEEDAQAARKAERNTEKAYRSALEALFNVEAHADMLESVQGDTGHKVMSVIMEVFKRREIYRHMSNAADRLARASENLHDIVVKIS
jgi:uncharacterized protein